MPQAAREAFAAGLVQREADRIMALLRDPRATAVHLVTLAEEMPVVEALEARAQLETLRLPPGYVIVNRVHRRRFDAGALGRLRAARTERALLGCVADHAAEESGWAEINAVHLERLRAAIAATPLLELPYLFAEEFDRREVELLSRLLETGAGGGRVAAGARRA
jgi:anion-transporting  ArsA/GET3 family ATPase